MHPTRHTSLPQFLLLAGYLGLAGSLPAQMVTTNADSGPGSLRQTLADAPSGTTITFDPSRELARGSGRRFLSAFPAAIQSRTQPD